MRGRGLLVVLAMLGVGVAACTLWVDGQWNGYSGTCQLPNAGDNVCGACVTQKCQSFVDTTCGQGVTDQLDLCLSNPSDPSDMPGEWSCDTFFADASVYDPTQTQDESNLRHCVHDNCPTACSTCTDFDGGPGACGECLTTSCAPILNGIGGCCDDTDIVAGMVSCGSSVNHSCSDFLTYDTTLPDSGDDFNHCMRVFSQCVQTHCATPCQ